MSKKPQNPEPPAATREPRRIPLSAGAALRIEALYRAADDAARRLDAAVRGIVEAAGFLEPAQWYLQVDGDAVSLVEATPHE